ncbi:MAG: 2-isopropylmalate synthase [Halanaerobium sp.]|nr:MAG: 2-isopropylmalate synthase [Halanaerobium sp.]
MASVKIFDTTLRDGEQSPGVTLIPEEKLAIAKQLAKMKVNVIEAGFPISSDGDFNAVKMVAENVRGVEVAALARCRKSDIDRAWEAVKDAENPRIHIFIASSPIHLEYKLQMSEDEVLNNAVEAVKYAAQYTDNIEGNQHSGYSRLCCPFRIRAADQRYQGKDSQYRAGRNQCSLPQ